MKPPKCKTCGVEAWNHTCLGDLKAARELAKHKPQIKPKQQFSTGKRAR